MPAAVGWWQRKRSKAATASGTVLRISEGAFVILDTKVSHHRSGHGGDQLPDEQTPAAFQEIVSRE